MNNSAWIYSDFSYPTNGASKLLVESADWELAEGNPTSSHILITGVNKQGKTEEIYKYFYLAKSGTRELNWQFDISNYTNINIRLYGYLTTGQYFHLNNITIE